MTRILRPRHGWPDHPHQYLSVYAPTPAYGPPARPFGVSNFGTWRPRFIYCRRLKCYDYSRKLKALIQHVKNWNWNDNVSRLYAEIFTPDTIINPDQQPGAVLHELERRNKNKIPPGYKDAGKDDNAVGDLLNWFSILKAGTNFKKDVIFVTNDSKADWMVSSQKEALFTRP